MKKRAPTAETFTFDLRIFYDGVERKATLTVSVLRHRKEIERARVESQKNGK